MSLSLDSALGRTVYVEDNADDYFPDPALQAQPPPVEEPQLVDVPDPALAANQDPNNIPEPDPAAQMGSSGYFDGTVVGSIVDKVI